MLQLLTWLPHDVACMDDHNGLRCTVENVTCLCGYHAMQHVLLSRCLCTPHTCQRCGLHSERFPEHAQALASFRTPFMLAHLRTRPNSNV